MKGGDRDLKKTLLPIVALVLAASLVVPVAVPAMAHTEAVPYDVPLFAGSEGEDILFGEVNIWNDTENLYVQFVISESGWLLEQTHVHVATSLAGIPQTKNGGPKVGKFDHSDPHGLVKLYTYAIPLTWAPGTTLYIAAHADVGLYSDGIRCQWETAWGGCWGHQFPGRNWAIYIMYDVQ